MNESNLTTQQVSIATGLTFLLFHAHAHKHTLGGSYHNRHLLNQSMLTCCTASLCMCVCVCGYSCSLELHEDKLSSLKKPFY